LNVSLSFVSIMSPHRTITRAFDDTEIVTKGCHDPCVGIRAAPVGEAIISCGSRSPVVLPPAAAAAGSRYFPPFPRPLAICIGRRFAEHFLGSKPGDDKEWLRSA
jgi:hypothetical protein